MGPMQHAGLAAATSAAAVTQLARSYGFSGGAQAGLGMAEINASALRVLVASAAMGGVIWAGAGFGQWGSRGQRPPATWRCLG